MTHILVVLTSHDQLGDTGKKTGFWLEELAAPYYAFVDAGAEVTLASPKGGQPPLDPKSNETDFQTDKTRRFEADATAKAVLSNTKSCPMSRSQISTRSSIRVAMGRFGIWLTTPIRSR